MQNSELFAASWLGCEPVLLQDGTDDFLLSPTLDQIVTFLLCTWWDVNLWLFFSCLDDTWWLLHGIQKTKQTTDLAESVLDGELVTICFVRCGMKTIDLPVVSEQTHGADDLTVSEQVKQSNDKLVLLQLIQTTFMLCNPWDMNPRPSYNQGTNQPFAVLKTKTSFLMIPSLIQRASQDVPAVFDPGHKLVTFLLQTQSKITC